MLLDAVATGGQAATSARIENFLGFPFGVSGSDLAARAAVQALKFGTRIISPCRVTALGDGPLGHVVELGDGTRLDTRAVVVASGAEYRRLPLERWEELTGSGIYYAATDLEARAVSGLPVVVVGGANSAGQAALRLARDATSVTLVVRGADVRASMSTYLVERIEAEARIDVRTATEVVELHGTGRLEAVRLRGRAGTPDPQPTACAGLFCFVGAVPATRGCRASRWTPTGSSRPTLRSTAADLDQRWADDAERPAPVRDQHPGDLRGGRRTQRVGEAGRRRGRGRSERGPGGASGPGPGRRPCARPRGTGRCLRHPDGASLGAEPPSETVAA